MPINPAIRVGSDDGRPIVASDPGLPEAQALPAIIVTTSAGGRQHFVVLWKRIGPFVQVMDPLVGRRWARIVRERRLGVRIVVMTAAQDARRRAEEIAADAYLSKPFDLDELIAVMERICSNL